MAHFSIKQRNKQKIFFNNSKETSVSHPWPTKVFLGINIVQDLEHILMLLFDFGG